MKYPLLFQSLFYVIFSNLLLTSTIGSAQSSPRITIDNHNMLNWDGTPQVSLAAYLDNSDHQTIAIENNRLRISNGGEVDLSVYEDNTDQQFMYKFGHTLFLQNGSQVNFDSYMDNTDEQTINAELVDNSRLSVEISNGNNVMVDLTPLVERQRGEIRDLTTLVQRMEDRIAALESCACGDRLENGNVPNKTTIQTEEKPATSEAKLFQNIPNPFQSTSAIKYFVPENAERATMQFSNTSGKIVSKVNLAKKGNAELNVNSAELANGIYLYTLYVDGKLIATRKMVVK